MIVLFFELKKTIKMYPYSRHFETDGYIITYEILSPYKRCNVAHACLIL